MKRTVKPTTIALGRDEFVLVMGDKMLKCLPEGRKTRISRVRLMKDGSGVRFYTKIAGDQKAGRKLTGDEGRRLRFNRAGNTQLVRRLEEIFNGHPFPFEGREALLFGSTVVPETRYSATADSHTGKVCITIYGRDIVCKLLRDNHLFGTTQEGKTRSSTGPISSHDIEKEPRQPSLFGNPRKMGPVVGKDHIFVLPPASQDMGDVLSGRLAILELTKQLRQSGWSTDMIVAEVCANLDQMTEQAQ